MQEPAELLPRQNFSDRHPGLSKVPAEKLPVTVGIALGTADMREYPAIVQSALSMVHEYSDSPIADIVVYADSLLDPRSTDMDRAYIINFLEGKVSHGLGAFKRDKVKVNWFSGGHILTQSSKDSLFRVQTETSPESDINLHFVMDPEGFELRPEILFRSEQTSTEAGEKLVGPAAIQVSVGKSLAEVNNSAIDASIVEFANTQPSSPTTT